MGSAGTAVLSVRAREPEQGSLPVRSKADIIACICNPSVLGKEKRRGGVSLETEGPASL